MNCGLNKKLVTAAGVLVCLGMIQAPAQAASVFINELHYDNDGGDINEFVEIAGPAGTDLSGWLIELMNGSNGSKYGSIVLSGIIPDQQSGFGTLSFNQGGIQNGAPDGLALVDAAASVVQFLSYEGSFVATNGAASGLTSLDIGVAEGNSTPVGFSLQQIGSGANSDDFAWADAMTQTPGNINTNQSFVTNSTAVPTPALLPGLIGFGLSLARKRKLQAA